VESFEQHGAGNGSVESFEQHCGGNGPRIRRIALQRVFGGGMARIAARAVRDRRGALGTQSSAYQFAVFGLPNTRASSA
jgi:hypothetical protein